MAGVAGRAELFGGACLLLLYAMGYRQVSTETPHVVDLPPQDWLFPIKEKQAIVAKPVEAPHAHLVRAGYREPKPMPRNRGAARLTPTMTGWHKHKIGDRVLG